MPNCDPIPALLIVGSINSDLILRTSKLPSAGESFIGVDYHRVAGGKGANQAVAAARLGARSVFVARTGEDSEGQTLKAKLLAEGVCTDFVYSSPASQTGLAVITVDDRGQNSIVVIPGANARVTEDDVRAALRKGPYDAVLLQLEIPTETVVATCRLAEAHGIPVVLDAGPAQDFPLEQLQGIDILTPNETETLALTGIEPDTHEAAVAAAKILVRRSRARSVVLKLGERGALLVDREGAVQSFRAHTVRAVDATAAGDAFTAAMTVSYLQTRDIRRGVLAGNAAGALAVMTLGAQPSLPTARALEEFCALERVYVS